MKNPLIKLENVSKYYSGPGGIGLGIRKVNVEFHLGEFVIITGESGSGKTTLLNVISGMDSYEEGALIVEGEDTSYFGPKEYEEYRRNYISFIFQNYNLIDSFTVLQNVELALLSRGVDAKERRKQADKIIAEVGLKNRRRQRVAQLSGGEKQRVAIARALAQDAPIIACDEITGNLDKTTGRDIIALLKRVSKNRLVLLVSHDPEEAIMVASRMITMHDGSIEHDVELNHEVDVDEEPKLPNIKPVDKKSIVRLNFQTLFSTPRKSFLMFFILLIATLLCAYSYTIYIMNSGDYGGIEIYPGREYNTFSERILLKKEDDTTFSQAELDWIKNVRGIRNLVTYDFALDVDVNFYLRDIDYSYFYGRVRSIKDLKSSDLSFGRLPTSATEIVVGVSADISNVELNDLVNQPIRISFGYENEVRDMTIVGVVEITGYESIVYLVDDVMSEINKQGLFKYSKLSLADDSLYSEFNSNFPYQIIASANLTDAKAKVTIYEMGRFGEDNFRTKSDLIFENAYHLGDKRIIIPGLDIDIRRVENKDYNYDWKGSIGKMPFYAIVELSLNNYQKLVTDELYQVSVIAENKDVVSNIVKELEKGPFYAKHFLSQQYDIQNPFSIISQIFIIFFVIILIFGIYSLSYLSLRNIVYSQKGNYLIMRSLGIDGGKIRWLVYLQMLTLTLLGFIATLVIWFILNFRKQVYFIEAFADLGIFDLLFVGVIMVSMAFLLSYRFSKHLLQSTIVTKET